MAEPCLYSWQVGCDWTIAYLWRRTSWLVHLDLLVLALMCVHAVVVFIRLFRQTRIHSAAEVVGGVSEPRTTLADLNRGLGTLRTISIAAPFLGLVGTCIGIFDAFSGGSMQKAAFVAMVISRLGMAPIPSAAGILVATLSLWFHNWICGRLVEWKRKTWNEVLEQAGRIQGASRFPLKERLSGPPASALIAAPTMGILALVFVVIHSIASTPLGLSVRLLEIGALDSQHPATPLIIQMDAKTYGALAVYVNSKETAPGALENELRRDLDASTHRIAYVEAESNARWTDVVNVIDTVKGLGADVVLITACPIKSERKSVREEHAPPSPVNYLREKN